MDKGNNIMLFKDLLLNKKGKLAEKQIVIIGINPLIDDLLRNAQLFSDLLRCNSNLNITIIYEDDTENFNQFLYNDKALRQGRIEPEKLQSARRNLLGGETNKGGFVDSILKSFPREEQKDVGKRLKLYQNNLRHNINLVLVDDKIYYCVTGLELPTLEDYECVTEESNSRLYSKYYRMISFFLSKDTGGLYLSDMGEELIQLYDNWNVPRGIAPRKAFYTLDYQRYSVWVFIFNRRGELLLHRRSPYTADNRGLWDKSSGGHVDLKDRSTVLTAKREVVEELFMPEAEYTSYMTEKIRDFIDFGEWNTVKRPESFFKSDFDGLSKKDWVVFRPIDRETGYPMTIRRPSHRKMHVADLDENGNKIFVLDDKGHKILNAKGKAVYKEHIETWPTRFISDVYLMVAPAGYIDTEEEMEDLFRVAEEKGAASKHKLISIDDLVDDVLDHPDNYTEDMTYMIVEQRWILTQFSEFIKNMFR